ncbi:MAG: hypothetical protein IPN87_06410 [Saprospiraceae bacterium]|nr:hypothetical protein [Candidatus Brachybacter algidus]
MKKYLILQATFRNKLHYVIGGEMDSYKIKQCIHNDRVAQKELYDMYKTNMFVLCMRYFSEQEEAKDALQDGFIKVFRDLYQFDASKGALGSWIRRVMVNTCLGN